MDHESERLLAPPTGPDEGPIQPSILSPTPDMAKALPDSRHLATDVKIWLPSDHPQPAPKPALGDDYFVPTASEAQKAFSGQVAQRERLTDAPLLTRSLREREENQKRNEKFSRFPLTRIRIRFGDRTMLEGTLESKCTISDVYKFVQECLRDDVGIQPFVLYQTPPRREFLSTDPKAKLTSLLDLQLAPSSLLYIKFSEGSYNHTTNPPPLLPDLLEKAEPLPSPPQTDDAISSVSTLEKGKQKAEELLKSGAKVPKWLKNFKKK
ncbi:hypothetical protein O181_011970 [Austropuccinia psidii MF-1]|uniref:UBX domain-containing protein n=1 Tax=Austropuccinia psidii MF-1 TaxID=1389203 RepID=A0A9Q3GMF9_9BASI|nr:hypothetical protein [Austropuccinia psidii MF-1]